MKFGDIDIDKSYLMCFAHTVFNECVEFYKDPENIKKFEAWKAARDKEAAGKGEPA